MTLITSLTNTITLKSLRAWRPLTKTKMKRETTREKKHRLNPPRHDPRAQPSAAGLDLLPPQEQLHPPLAPNPLTVTISPRDQALATSKAAGLLQPHLPPYEWCFWTDALLYGPKPFKLAGCGFCVVHRLLDKINPDGLDK